MCEFLWRCFKDIDIHVGLARGPVFIVERLDFSYELGAHQTWEDWILVPHRLYEFVLCVVSTECKGCFLFMAVVVVPVKSVSFIRTHSLSPFSVSIGPGSIVGRTQLAC